MACALDLIEMIDDLVFHQRVQQQLYRHGMIRDRLLDRLLLSVHLDGEDAFIQTDALDHAAGQHRLLRHVKQLKLQRRASGIYRNNFRHVSFLLRQ